VALLNASLRTQLRKEFGALPHPVTLLVFVGAACETCGETRALVEELASIADGKIRVDVHDLDAKPAEATRYRIDKAPPWSSSEARAAHGTSAYGSTALLRGTSLPPSSKTFDWRAAERPICHRQPSRRSAA
jgi:hypothetical protein